ncbi:MAG: NERD domain-containing protein [Bacilli bacterium]|nr:NERD domain-containing protein [Bacilli bacterium]
MSKRRRKRSDSFLIFMIALSIGLAFVISGIVSSITGVFNTNVFIIVFIISLIVTGTIILILSSPKVKGKIGEYRVNRILKKLSKKFGGEVISDVIIPGEDGKTSQIDHIYFSEYGILVIETKNYAGRIYGNDTQRERTQVFVYGKVKNKLYNPVKQNATHIYRLKELIDVKLPFFSIVIFVNNNIDYIDSDSVYTLMDLKHIFDSVTEKIISPESLNKAIEVIKVYKENPVKTNKDHIKEIKEMKKDINNNICPRCGGELVLRKGRNGNFYGCSNFPNCKFTKNI